MFRVKMLAAILAPKRFKQWRRLCCSSLKTSHGLWRSKEWIRGLTTVDWLLFSVAFAHVTENRGRHQSNGRRQAKHSKELQRPHYDDGSGWRYCVPYILMSVNQEDKSKTLSYLYLLDSVLKNGPRDFCTLTITCVLVFAWCWCHWPCLSSHLPLVYALSKQNTDNEEKVDKVLKTWTKKKYITNDHVAAARVNAANALADYRRNGIELKKRYEVKSAMLWIQLS